MLRPLLEYLIHPLVEDPKKVRIDCIETTEVVLFCIWASKGDLGRLLGKKGQTVEDLRSVMDAVSQRAGKEVIIDVVEAQQPRRRRRRRSSQKSAQNSGTQSRPKSGARPNQKRNQRKNPKQSSNQGNKQKSQSNSQRKNDNSQKKSQ